MMRSLLLVLWLFGLSDAQMNFNATTPKFTQKLVSTNIGPSGWTIESAANVDSTLYCRTTLINSFTFELAVPAMVDVPWSIFKDGTNSSIYLNSVGLLYTLKVGKNVPFSLPVSIPLYFGQGMYLVKCGLIAHEHKHVTRESALVWTSNPLVDTEDNSAVMNSACYQDLLILNNPGAWGEDAPFYSRMQQYTGKNTILVETTSFQGSRSPGDCSRCHNDPKTIGKTSFCTSFIFNCAWTG
jgi:hypothetical protein